MLWLFLVISAHFLNAVTYVIDRILLLKNLQNPLVYAFYTGILSIVVLVAAPFGMSMISLPDFLLSLLAGALFLVSLFLLYKALKENEVTRVIPAVGGFIPLFSLAFSYVFLGERLAPVQLSAFALLVVGGALIYARKFKETYRAGGFLLGVLAAFFFAVFFVLTKYVYLSLGFIDGFIWPRFGSFLGAILLLLYPGSRKIIFNSSRHVKNKKKTGLAFVASRIFGAASFALINYAVYLSSVSLVNALQGVQYAFLLLIVSILSYKWPLLLREELKKGVLAQKIFSIALISLGVILLLAHENFFDFLGF